MLGPRLLLLATLLATFAAKRADACEPLPCQRSYLLPEAGSIPANAAGIVAFVDARSGNAPVVSPSDAVLTRRADKTAGFSAFSIAPKGGFVAGTTREIELTSPCTSMPPARLVARLKITEQAAPPTALGTLSAAPLTKGKLQVGTSSGSCSITEEGAWVDVTVQLHASALPWVDLLEYATFVDDKPWRASSSIGVAPPPGASWVGRGRDRVYVLCPGKFGFPGTTDGEHEIVMRARVNGGPEVATPALTVRVSCSDAPAPKPRTDPGPPPPETPDPVAGPVRRSRCSCECVGSGGETPYVVIGLAVGALLFRRRR